MRYNCQGVLEVVSKPLIALKSKAEADEKAEHIQGYVSILKKPTTQLLGVRRGFETTSNDSSIAGKITCRAADVDKPINEGD